MTAYCEPETYTRLTALCDACRTPTRVKTAIRGEADSFLCPRCAGEQPPPHPANRADVLEMQALRTSETATCELCRRVGYLDWMQHMSVGGDESVLVCPSCWDRPDPGPDPFQGVTDQPEAASQVADLLEASVRERIETLRSRLALAEAQIEAERTRAHTERARYLACKQQLTLCSASRVTLDEEMRRARTEAECYRSALERIEGGDWSAEYCRQIAREALEGEGDE